MADPPSPSRAASPGRHPEPELCGVCGGDGRIDNAWGQVAKCPSCHGSGRRREDTGFRDVTKTKESHHRNTNRAPVVEKQIWPSTPAGAQLASEIRDAALADEVKARLTREIIDHEASHGQCTKTFLKKVRKQFRPAGG
jgi:hypothetical protein